MHAVKEPGVPSRFRRPEQERCRRAMPCPALWGAKFLGSEQEAIAASKIKNWWAVAVVLLGARLAGKRACKPNSLRFPKSHDFARARCKSHRALATTCGKTSKELHSVTLSEFRWFEGEVPRPGLEWGQSRRAKGTYKGARREKSHPHSDRIPVAGRLDVRLLPG